MSLITKYLDFEILYYCFVYIFDKVMYYILNNVEDMKKIYFPTQKYVCYRCTFVKMYYCSFSKNPGYSSKPLSWIFLSSPSCFVQSIGKWSHFLMIILLTAILLSFIKKYEAVKVVNFPDVIKYNFLFYVLWNIWTLTIFILFSFIFLILLYFTFLWKDNEGTWQWSHMTGHMMWHHKPRTWWKGLEDDIRALGVHIVALSRT